MTDTAYLTQDGLSEFDLAHMTEIIREGYGSWYHAASTCEADASRRQHEHGTA